MNTESNRTRRIVLAAIILSVMLLGACSAVIKAQSKGAATEAEVKEYFTRHEKQNVDGMGWKNSQVTFQKIQLAAPVKYNFVDVGVQTCYPAKVSWTYSYENYNSRRTVSYTNDFYRFYRNEFGDLVMGEHGNYDNSKTTDEPLGENKAGDKNANKLANKAQDQSAQTGEVDKVAAENKAGGEYPAPDTAAMDKWYEITGFEYGDLATGDNILKFQFKPKVGHYDRPSTVFKVAFLDKDGAEVTGFAHSLSIDYATEIGEVGQATVKAPTEAQMVRVVTVKVIRIKE